jgi:hypothetical protein
MGMRVDEALDRLNRVQALVESARRFRGYSGGARLASGVLAVAAAAVMAGSSFPASPPAHLAGWAVVLASALALNYGALALWFLFSRDAGRRWQRLAPALEAVPALAVGALLSVALVVRGQYDLLFGSWMCLYGLAHFPYRFSLPAGIRLVAVFYLGAGVMCLLVPAVAFTDPWPMGLVFGVGETCAAAVLYRARQRVPR